MEWGQIKKPSKRGQRGPLERVKWRLNQNLPLI